MGDEGVMKKNILIRAPLVTMSGYGVHSRQICKWALGRSDFNVQTQILPWGMTPWVLNHDAEDGLIGNIIERSVNPSESSKSDITFQVQLPNEWDPSLGKINVGISAVVEADRCNPEWISSCNNMTAVVVPSEHTKKVLKDTGDVRVPIYVIPETYHKSVGDDDLPPLDLNLSTSFNFLVFAQFTGGTPNTDRKNLFNTVKWLCEIFSNDPDVGIILKTNSGCNSRIDRQITEKLLSNLLSEVRKGPYPKFHFLHGAMTESEVAALYRVPSIKALVSLTRGEGFGLPILEAAASGLPVIATGWSGHLDFLKHGKFIAVRHRLSEIPKERADGNIWMPKSKWAEPVEEDAKKCLTRFRKKPDIPKRWAVELKKKMRQNFSERAINNLYNNLINDLA